MNHEISRSITTTPSAASPRRARKAPRASSARCTSRSAPFARVSGFSASRDVALVQIVRRTLRGRLAEVEDGVLVVRFLRPDDARFVGFDRP